MTIERDLEVRFGSFAAIFSRPRLRLPLVHAVERLRHQRAFSVDALLQDGSAYRLDSRVIRHCVACILRELRCEAGLP